MNKKLISLVLGLMCVALTYGICVQIKTVNNSNSKISQNYEENQLRAEVLKYKEKYDNKLKELENAEKNLEKEREKATSNNEELENVEVSIKNGNKVLGLTEVTGPGVTITLNDSQNLNNVLNIMDAVVHDVDVLAVINELKNAGAEAISINDQRLVPTTGITCGGNIIDINGEKVGAPFTIKAIGLPEQLAALERPGGYLNLLKEKYSIVAELKREKSITIPKYNGVINFKFVQNVK